MNRKACWLGLVGLVGILVSSPLFGAGSAAPAWMETFFRRAVDEGLLTADSTRGAGGGELGRMGAALACNRLLLAKASGKPMSAELRRDLIRASRELSEELSVLSSLLAGFEKRLSSVEDRLSKVERCEIVEPETGKVVCRPVAAEKAGEGKTAEAEIAAERAKLPLSQQGYPFPLKPVLARRNDNVRIGGIYKWWWKHEESKAFDEMAARNARLYVYGDVSPDVRFTYQFDTAADYWKGTDAPTLRDGKLLFNLDRKNPWRTDVQVGRFIPRLYRYHPVAIDTMDFIYYPRFETGSKNLAVWRQSGMELRHRNRESRYAAGFANGSAVNENSWMGEDNNSKDFWLQYELGADKKPWYGGLMFWKGKADVAKDDRIRKSFFVQHRQKRWWALFEMAWADDENGGLEVDRKGLLLQAIYQPEKSRFEWLARYDRWDADESVDGDEDRWLTLGLNYFIAERKAFFSLNWIDKRNEALAEPDDEELVGQFTLVF